MSDPIEAIHDAFNALTERAQPRTTYERVLELSRAITAVCHREIKWLEDIKR